MTDITITLTQEQAHQALRALAGRKRTFRKTLDPSVLGAIVEAQNKLIQAINTAQETLLDTSQETPVVSTSAPRKRRTTKKED